jgi:protein-tyrosine-phosphatase
MIIHLISTGNIYRSRLAEAHCKSKGVSGLDVMSSGIQTILNGGLPIASYAADVLRAHGLERFAAPSWPQTTPALIRASDVLVFMEREHYHFCNDWVDSSRQRFEIWDIPDVGSEVGATRDHDHGRANLCDNHAAGGFTGGKIRGAGEPVTRHLCSTK